MLRPDEEDRLPVSWRSQSSKVSKHLLSQLSLRKGQCARAKGACNHIKLEWNCGDHFSLQEMVVTKICETSQPGWDADRAQ